MTKIKMMKMTKEYHCININFIFTDNNKDRIWKMSI